MSYVLEAENEFARLERQSQTPAYDFESELRDTVSEFLRNPPARVLDAGCGSGIVTRYLSRMFSKSKVTGCDASDLRVQQAKQAAKGILSIDFSRQDLANTDFETSTFDFIVCRFVIQHLTPDSRRRVLQEFHRILRPGGKLVLIDMDGAFFNLYPQPRDLSEDLQQLQADPHVDMMVGRKLPWLLGEAGFQKIDWKIQTLEFRGELLKTEIQLMRERLAQVQGYFAEVFGSRSAAERFAQSYLRAMEQENSVLFYNKFVVAATKPSKP